MSQLIEIKVPDIGDFKDVDVIEILVKPGDRVEKEGSLVTLESDKASMEIPSPHAGVVRELRMNVGDKVAEGTVILLMEAVEAAAVPVQETVPEKPVSAAAPPRPVPAQGATSPAGPVDIEAEVVVLGSGPGGYTAAFRASDLGRKVILIERYPNLGGCASRRLHSFKALHAPNYHRRRKWRRRYPSAPSVDIDKLALESRLSARVFRVSRNSAR
jgi:dihydrolipoamide dehydrogenase